MKCVSLSVLVLVAVLTVHVQSTPGSDPSKWNDYENAMLKGYCERQPPKDKLVIKYLGPETSSNACFNIKETADGEKCKWGAWVATDFYIAPSQCYCCVMPKSEPCWKKGDRYKGNDIKHIRDVTTPEDCQKQCQETAACVVWTLNEATNRWGGCWLHHAKGQLVQQDNFVAGPKNC